MIETYDLLGVRIAITNIARTCQQILNWIESSSSVYVCIAPVSTIVDCHRDPNYKKIVNQSGMTTPDGMPVVWAGQRRGHDVTRTYGPDLLPAMCEYGQKTQCRHFFYGADATTLDILIEKLVVKFPQLIVAGKYAPPHRKVHDMEDQKVLQSINDSQADILWVGLGSPKQDFWMAEHRDTLSVPVIVGVGAAFDFLAGTKRQAPAWMRKNGLEWLFRLTQEPGRLWKRYLVGNSIFLFLMMKETFKGLFSNKNNSSEEKF